MITAGAKNLVGQTINCYSYGSGAAATMFRLKVKRMPGYVKNMHEVLDNRNFVDAKMFDQIMDEYAETYARTSTGRLGSAAAPSRVAHITSNRATSSAGARIIRYTKHNSTPQQQPSHSQPQPPATAKPQPQPSHSHSQATAKPSSH